MKPTDFRDAAAHATTPERETALACLGAAIDAARPERVVGEAVSIDGDALVVDGARYELDGDALVLGGGKAAGGVADALEGILGDRLSGGAVVTPDPATDRGRGDPDGRIERLPGDHPEPSERGVAGAERVAELAREADEGTLVIAVVTGGASALLPAPAAGVSLGDLRTTTRLLLASGADIREINAVRKHLSTLKGGGLARLAAPATVVTLAFSDVVGDDLGVIGSGPTAPDDTTFDDALAVLDRHDLDVPAPVRERLERGAAGELAETPSADDPVFDRVHAHVLADGATALAAARRTARDRGYGTLVLSSRIRGEAREAAKTHVAIAEESLATGDPVAPPAVVLSGGECTVTVRGDGTGGPNQEFALSAAIDLPAGATLACVDSDGRDGGSDAAGALVDGATVTDPGPARAALRTNDSGTYLGDRGALLYTGATGTNVNDLRALVIADPEDRS